MAKRLVLQGFTISPVIHAIDLDVPIPTIETQQYGQQFVGPGEIETWARENWPDLWSQMNAAFEEAQAAQANAAVEAKRAARKPRKKSAG